jgi:hypothetical protein
MLAQPTLTCAVSESPTCLVNWCYLNYTIRSPFTVIVTEALERTRMIYYKAVYTI